MIMRVSNRTRPGSLAGAIANHLRDMQAGIAAEDAEGLIVQAIGPLPTEHTCRGLALARLFVAGDGIAFSTVISDLDVKGALGKTRALRFTLQLENGARE